MCKYSCDSVVVAGVKGVSVVVTGVKVVSVVVTV